MVRTQRPDGWLTETVMILTVQKDFSTGTPGVRLYGSLPGRKGLLQSHWPSVQGHITPSQLSDISVTAAKWVDGAILNEGIVQGVLPME